MESNVSNQVIAKIDDEVRPLPRRTLDLGNIRTPELGSLSPHRNEIAPKGIGRDAALIAYSDRLRSSYKSNEAGLRDGMLKLGEAFRDGQIIAVSCFCRAGETCHADVVKMAIEKVGQAIKARAATSHESHRAVAEGPAIQRANPRTGRAINEILAAGSSDLILSKLNDTGGRSRAEHASFLNRHSQFARDLYERGAVVRDGVLIAPKEDPSPGPPLAIATNEYAVKRLSRIVDDTRAKELAPQVVGYGERIAGTTADRDTKVKVFNWIYDALEGRSEFLRSEKPNDRSEAKEERFEATLKDIAVLADELGRLEPSDGFEQLQEAGDRSTTDAVDRLDGELSLDKIYEEAIVREHEATFDLGDRISTPPGFERFELESTELSRMAAEMPKGDLDRWIGLRLPELDRELEGGKPVGDILEPFRNVIHETAKHDPSNKQAAVDDLRFASAYLAHQLKQPESRLRHFNARYRSYASMLEGAASRAEVIDAASRIRLENARVGFQWGELAEAEKAATPRHLSRKEMQFLFTETSPRHYTSDMNVAKLAYSDFGASGKSKTESLLRGEIKPSAEASRLIESLESRLGRRDLKDALSATKHFFQSLKTPNGELRYKNSFDHSEIYGRLPQFEKDFIYQAAAARKEELEYKLAHADRTGRRPVDADVLDRTSVGTEQSSFREGLKSGLTDLLMNPEVKDLDRKVGTLIQSKLQEFRPGGDHLPLDPGLVRELGESILRRMAPKNSRSAIAPESERTPGPTPETPARMAGEARVR